MVSELRQQEFEYTRFLVLHMTTFYYFLQPQKQKKGLRKQRSFVDTLCWQQGGCFFYQPEHRNKMSTMSVPKPLLGWSRSS